MTPIINERKDSECDKEQQISSLFNRFVFLRLWNNISTQFFIHNVVLSADFQDFATLIYYKYFDLIGEMLVGEREFIGDK